MTWNNTSQPFRSPEDQNYSIWGGASAPSVDHGRSFNLTPPPSDTRHKIANDGLSLQVTLCNNSTGSFEENVRNPLFEIHVTTPTRVWKVPRRYNDFIIFHQQLPELNLIFALPPLKGSDTSPLLSTYLEHVSSTTSIRRSKLFCQFLDDTSGVLILQAEVQTLMDEKKALQSEVSEVRGMLSTYTQTIQQQAKALMLFEKRLAALDNGGSNAQRNSQERRKSWGNTGRSSHDRNSRESDPDRSSFASRGSSDEVDDFSQDCSPDGSPRNYVETVPDVHFPPPSFSLNNHADELIALFTPSYPSNKHRQRVVKFVGNHIRKSLGATSLCLGSFAERTYLPDQPVDMSCFLCRGQETSWFIRVNEALCRLSGESKSGDSMRISNVNFVNKTEDSKYLRCTVNNVAVNLSANQLGGLCLASFVEEVDAQLGNDHLLKRSLLLVKAWWMYESAPEGSRNNLNVYFPEDALSVMVIALFNSSGSPKASNQLPNTPLELLSKFFETYMSVDWARTCITVSGLRDLLSTDPEPTSSLIPQALLDKYRHCFKLKPVSVPTSPTRRRQSKTGGGGGSELRATIEEEESPFAASAGLGDLSESIIDEAIGDDNEFDVREMNIAHPLNPYENLIPFHMLDGKRLGRTRTAMASSAMALAHILHLSADGHHDEANLELDNMFSHSWARFGGGWRPDIGAMAKENSSNDLRSSIRSESGRRGSERRASFQSENSNSRRGSERRGSLRDSSDTTGNRTSYQSNASYDSDDSENEEDGLMMDCLSMGSEVLWKQVEYSRLLLEVEVTEPALRTLAAEILTDKGPLPVGEIGKLLQEITANSNLSTILKDKFGGLKKFLEKYEADFFVSTDHPFNPHVYLKSEVTEEQIQMLLSGQPIATPVSAPSRRSKKAARRKNNMLTPVNTTSTTIANSNVVSPLSPPDTSHPGTSQTPPTNAIDSVSAGGGGSKVDQSRFTNLFISQSELSEAVSPRNPNAAVFVPRHPANHDTQ